mmetsp:Transcript_22314/g.55156  ORF Transcript_22314/g.55156 Transcript_22314/m.55156 type:complete len:87 (-) Transcript_22314:200-460(-)
MEGDLDKAAFYFAKSIGSISPQQFSEDDRQDIFTTFAMMDEALKNDGSSGHEKAKELHALFKRKWYSIDKVDKAKRKSNLLRNDGH